MENNKHNQGGSTQDPKSNGAANTQGKTPLHGIGNTANESGKKPEDQKDISPKNYTAPQASDKTQTPTAETNKTQGTLNNIEGNVDKNVSERPEQDKRDEQK